MYPKYYKNIYLGKNDIFFFILNPNFFLSFTSYLKSKNSDIEFTPSDSPPPSMVWTQWSVIKWWLSDIWQDLNAVSPMLRPGLVKLSFYSRVSKNWIFLCTTFFSFIIIIFCQSSKSEQYSRCFNYILKRTINLMLVIVQWRIRFTTVPHH